MGNIKQRAGILAAVKLEQTKMAVTCIEGPDAGKFFSLVPKNCEIILGRGEDSDIVFTDDEISGRHARITVEMTNVSGGNYRPVFFIEDMKSTNGTAVNRHQLKIHERHKLVLGDIIRLGQGEGHNDLLVHYTT